MTAFLVNEIEDEMVRDFTSVTPRSKSEVRRRINEYAVKAYEIGKQEVCKKIGEGLDPNYCSCCERNLKIINEIKNI